MKASSEKTRLFSEWSGVLTGIAAISFLGWAVIRMSPEGRAGLPDKILQGIAEHFGALIVGIIALILAWDELRGIRQAAEKRIEVDTEARKLETAYREREATRFLPLAEEIATIVTGSLMTNVNWARVALEAAKLGPYSGGAFGERSHQFEAEKKALAQAFLPCLIKRCRAFVESGHEVYLMIDAGTTLYPLFGELGKESVRQYGMETGHGWLEHLHLSTNNLPGLEHLINEGRRGKDRHSSLAIQHCHLLPGIPMPLFAAVGGTETDEAIQRFGADQLEGQKKKFIALVVGNWVRIRKTSPRCPIPMARGEKGFHLSAKNAFVKKADEVYVISPLGKIWLAEQNEVNSAMGLRAGDPDPENEQYADVDIDSPKAATVRLVSTRRAQGRLLHDHSERVQEAVGVHSRTITLDEIIDSFATAPIAEIQSLFFPFQPSAKTPEEEKLIEFPHERTRKHSVLSYFL